MLSTGNSAQRPVLSQCTNCEGKQVYGLASAFAIQSGIRRENLIQLIYLRKVLPSLEMNYEKRLAILSNARRSEYRSDWNNCAQFLLTSRYIEDIES